MFFQHNVNIQIKSMESPKCKTGQWFQCGSFKSIFGSDWKQEGMVSISWPETVIYKETQTFEIMY